MLFEVQVFNTFLPVHGHQNGHPPLLNDPFSIETLVQ